MFKECSYLSMPEFDASKADSGDSGKDNLLKRKYDEAGDTKKKVHIEEDDDKVYVESLDPSKSDDLFVESQFIFCSRSLFFPIKSR